MLRTRIIPCLDVADGRVVKGTRFVDLVDEGDPPELAERYAREGADELVFLDITAAPAGRGAARDRRATARRAFIPLTVGGGVRSVDEMRDVLQARADKVSLNTAAVADPDLVTACAQVRQPGGRRRDRRPHDDVRELGGRREGRPRGDGPRRGPLGGTRRVDRGGRAPRHLDRPGRDVIGFDTALLQAITSRVTVPVIASGGASGPPDFVRAVVDGGADAVLAASVFHRRLHSIAEVKAAMAGGRPVGPGDRPRDRSVHGPLRRRRPRPGRRAGRWRRGRS